MWFDAALRPLARPALPDLTMVGIALVAGFVLGIPVLAFGLMGAGGLVMCVGLLSPHLLRDDR
jgi:hypothetical protein